MRGGYTFYQYSYYSPLGVSKQSSKVAVRNYCALSGGHLQTRLTNRIGLTMQALLHLIVTVSRVLYTCHGAGLEAVARCRWWLVAFPLHVPLPSRDSRRTSKAPLTDRASPVRWKRLEVKSL